MILTFHDGACIRASAGDTTLVFGPVSKSSKKYKPVNFGADVAFVSLNHPDMNGAEEAGRGDKQPFVVFGPGEYEVKEVTASGFPAGSTYGGEGRINTVYSIHFDGLSVLYLGALGDLDLPAEVLEMDAPDVLIIPVGGEGVLSAAEAEKLAVKLEAKIVIPILYDDKSLKQFLKESGAESTKPVEKLTIKPRDLVGKESEVVVLASQYNSAVVVQKTINNLKDRPKDERKVVAGGIAITIVIVLLLAWSIVFFKRIQAGTQQVTLDSGAQDEFNPSSVKAAQDAIQQQDQSDSEDLYHLRDDAAAMQVGTAQQVYINQVGGSGTDQFGNPTSY
jgi:L-ascorbate metabolism protein UlaG (beta-lactamase superfamily)